MMKLEQGGSPYLGTSGQSSVSMTTQAKIDNEILSIIKQCQQDARDLLKANRATLEALAEFLLKEETITGSQFMEILKRQHALNE